MTKRLLLLFLVCILAIPIFVVPASATSAATGVYDYNIWQGITDVYGIINEFAVQIFPDVIDDLSADISDYIADLSGDVTSILSSIKNVLSGTITPILQNIQTINATLRDWQMTTDAGMREWFGYMQSWLSQINTQIANGFSNVSIYFENLR